MANVVYNAWSQIGFANEHGQGERLQGEWEKLFPLLRFAVLGLAEWQSRKFGKRSLVVTCIYRTKEENDALPNSSPQSLHMKWRAVDLRLPGWNTLDGANWGMEMMLYWSREMRSIDPRLQIDYHRGKNHIHVEFDVS